MTEPSKEDMLKFVSSAERLADAIGKLPTGNSSGNTMTVQVGVGPVAAGVMFGMFLMLALVLFRQDERIDALQDYLNVILINTPEKPNVSYRSIDLQETSPEADAQAGSEEKEVTP